MKKFYLFVAITILSVVSMLPLPAGACTSAIVAASTNPSGRPLLWKHRDTSAIDNKIEYIPASDGAFAYVALFNAADINCREAWMGMNSVGFAVMNTASYNLKDDKVSAKKMDREGFLMTIALRSCRSVDDFQRLLETLPRPMGVEANFGVIDASGNGAFFETNNHSFTRFDLKDAPDGLLIRTNYSHSGRPDEGMGYVREANAETLLRPYAAEHSITPELLTEIISRSFYHDLKKKDYAKAGEKWVVDQDFIPRYKSTATIVIEGVRPGLDPADIVPGQLTDEYIMWTGLGYPPCAEIVPVWCKTDGVAQDLRGIGPKGHAPMSDLVKERRNEVFALRRGNKDKYIDMTKLFNEHGTGYVQILTRQNHAVYDTISRKRDNLPSAAIFQSK